MSPASTESQAESPPPHSHASSRHGGSAAAEPGTDAAQPGTDAAQPGTEPCRGPAGSAGQRRSALRRGVLAAGAASAAVLLAGCGLVGVRVAEGDGGPVRISAQTTQGPEPVVEEPEGPSTEGMEQLSLSLGSNCPARVSLFTPEDWTGSTSGSSYYGMPVDAGIDSAGVSVYCTTGFGDSPAEGVDSSRSYQFTDPDTEIIVEKTSQAGDGYYWAFQAELGEEEIMYQGGPTTMMGVITHYPISGTVYQVNVTFTFPSDDQATREHAASSLSHLTVEGASITPPDWDLGG